MWELFERSNDFFLLHAGVVAKNDQAVIVSGYPGTGKTTLVLALLESGFTFYSDEICPIHKKTGKVHPFLRTPWVKADAPSITASDARLHDTLRKDKIPFEIKTHGNTKKLPPILPKYLICIDPGPAFDSFVNRFALKNWQAAGKTIHIAVQGTSMLPILQKGDQVALRLCAPERLTCGDIIGFMKNEQIIIHRLIMKKQRKGERLYFQAGDNQRGWTGVPEGQVLGKVVAVYPQTGGKRDMTRPSWTLVNPLLSYQVAARIFFNKLTRLINLP